MCTLSVLIVHYNTVGLLKQCLRSIFSEPPGIPFQVVVVDNASSDASAKRLPQEFPCVSFRFNRRNIGFARAVNQAIRMGEGRYLLLANPDTVVRPGGLKKLTAFMDDHPDAGVCGPRLVYPDGQLQLSCRQFPTLPALVLRISRLDCLIRGPGRHYLMADWDHTSVREVDWVIGGCMVLRREAVEEVGLLDEGFFK